jgi:beta-phosphoglucomutase
MTLWQFFIGEVLMNIKGVLFDFDGVIVKSMNIHYQAWQHVFNPFHVTIDRVEFYKMEGSGIEKVGEALINKYKIDAKLLPELMDQKRKFYDKIDQFQLYDGLIPLLDFLKMKHIPMAVVTGGSFVRVQSLINKHLAGYFTTIITPEVVEKTKPSPDPYLKAAEILKIPSTQCLVVENAPLGIHSAKVAEMTVIAIETTLSEKYLKEADYIVKNFNQIEIIINKLLD